MPRARAKGRKIFSKFPSDRGESKRRNKMTITHESKDSFFVGTIRKANYVNVFFGKVTDWGTRRNYTYGPYPDIKTATWKNIPLGNTKEEAKKNLQNKLIHSATLSPAKKTSR